MKQYYFLSLSFFLMTHSANAQDSHIHDHASAAVVPLIQDDATHHHEAASSLEDPLPPNSAPADARDPHAYSAGFTQTEGPYSLVDAQAMSHAEQPRIFTLRGERFEYAPEANTGHYELQAWAGSNFNRLILRTEGSVTRGDAGNNTTELLWGHALAAFWDSQIGVRADTFSDRRNRQWLAAGVQGLAPYWFELDATGYLSDDGQTEFVFDSEYALRLSQRLILQPRTEFTLRGKDDAENLMGKGLVNANVSIRLRYEITRQFAPYIGIETTQYFGGTAKLLRHHGESDRDAHYFAGVRFWF